MSLKCLAIRQSKKALKDYQYQGLCPKNEGDNLKWFLMAKDETGWVWSLIGIIMIINYNTSYIVQSIMSL